MAKSKKTNPAKKTAGKTSGKTAVKKTAAKKVISNKSDVKKTTSKNASAKKSTVKKTIVKKAEVKSKVKKVPATKKAAEEKVVVKKASVEITPEKKVRKAVKGYNKKDLKAIREIIMNKRNEIIEQLQNLKDQMMDPTTGQYVNENSPYSLHMAEQGTDAMEREKLYLWAQRENKFLGYLDDALQRIENGTYGLCIDCIDEPQHLCPTCPLIPLERLQAVPHTQHCLQIKQKMQTK